MSLYYSGLDLLLMMSASLVQIPTLERPSHSQANWQGIKVSITYVFRTSIMNNDFPENPDLNLSHVEKEKKDDWRLVKEKENL